MPNDGKSKASGEASPALILVAALGAPCVSAGIVLKIDYRACAKYKEWLTFHQEAGRVS